MLFGLLCNAARSPANNGRFCKTATTKRNIAATCFICKKIILTPLENNNLFAKERRMSKGNARKIQALRPFHRFAITIFRLGFAKSKKKEGEKIHIVFPCRGL